MKRRDPRARFPTIAQIGLTEWLDFLTLAALVAVLLMLLSNAR
jgi:hypothetical protein